jgi:hypothetical protein
MTATRGKVADNTAARRHRQRQSLTFDAPFYRNNRFERQPIFNTHSIASGDRF